MANAFLPQQIRRMVGSLIEVGTGKMNVKELGEMVNSKKIGVTQRVAPPNGLCLMKVNYSAIGFRNHENI